MAISSVVAAASVSASPPVSATPATPFSDMLKPASLGKGQSSAPMGSPPVRDQPSSMSQVHATSTSSVGRRGMQVMSSVSRVTGTATSKSVGMAKMLDGIGVAQKKLDGLLAMAQSGRTFSPAELLGLQARVYQASQVLDLSGKVVDKAAGGIRQVLQTQV